VASQRHDPCLGGIVATKIPDFERQIQVIFESLKED
jgi:hypothetical protein